MLKEFQELLEQPAWCRLVKFADEQMRMRQSQLLLPTHERAVPEGRPLPSDEFLKGEGSGIRLFTQLPSIMMETAKALIENEEMNNGNRTNDTSDARSA